MWQIKRSRPLILCWLTAVGLGGIHAWSARHDMNPDGINYLDLSDAFLKGDWEAAVNGTWSPLYPLLLSFARFIARPSPYWEFAVAHALNFVIYLFALAAVHFFLCQWLKDRQGRGADSDDADTQPDPAWLFLGYALFIWASLNLITLSKLVTDMCLAIFVYLAAGLLLKIRNGSHSWVLFALLGLSLGLGYLAKANMFLLAFVFLTAAGLCIGKWRVLFPRLAVAFLFFCLVSSPFIISLSKAKGRPTFSEVGKLAYAWHVNNVTKFNGVAQFVHWQGEQPRNGTPKHPTRRIRDVPAVYEFATPIGGTFPPGFDPS